MIHILQQFADVWGASLWRAAWQGAIAIAAAGAIHRWLTFLSPRVLCWVWRIACIKLLVALFWISPVELALLPPEARAIPARHTLSHITPDPEQEPGLAIAIQQVDSRPRSEPEPLRVASLVPSLLLPVWLIGVVYCIWRTTKQWLSILQLERTTEISAPDDLLCMCREQGDRLGIRRQPRLQLSSRVESPLLIGVWRPTIILPASSQATFSDYELRMMLAHELAHLKRHDLAWNWLPTMAAWLFFFHPLVWLMVRRWSEVQEAACDELLVQRRAAEPAAYGRLLVKLSALTSPETGSGSAAVGVLGSYRNLERRILTMARVRPFSVRRVTIAAGILLVAAVTVMVPWRLVAQKTARAQQTHVADSTTVAPLPPDAANDQKNGRDSEPDKAIEEDAARKIVIGHPLSKNVTVTQQFVGKIHAQRHVKIRALEKGYLEASQIKEGQTVKVGDPLFEVIPILYKKRLDIENADVTLAQLELNAVKKQFEDKVVSQNELLMRDAKLKKAQAKADLAKAELNFATVKAPFDGIIDRLYFQQGSLVLEGDVLTTISDNSVMWVYFNVPEARYLEFMRTKQTDDVQIELMLANGEKFAHIGKMGAIEAEFNNETGSIPYRADFPNPDRLLRHGQTGTILIERELNDAIVIPQRAVVAMLGKTYVFVVDNDGTAHKREVIIQNELDDIYVVKKGVSASDKIVLEGVRHLHDGEKVE